MSRRKTNQPPTQDSFGFANWGGKRRGAGRKARTQRSNHDHLKHEEIRREHAAHVTLRLSDGVPSLREDALFAVVVAVLTQNAFALFFRIVEFSVQRNHLHLLIEAADSAWRSSGMRSLIARLSFAINEHLDRPGRVFGDRYDLHVITSPREARNALLYVLQNARKHAREAGIAVPADWLDPRSSAPWFDGWLDARRTTTPKPVARAKTWLLREGWKRHGLLSVREEPRANVRKPAKGPAKAAEPRS